MYTYTDIATTICNMNVHVYIWTHILDMIHIYKYIDMIPAGQNGPLPGKAVSWKKENQTRNVFDHKMLEGLTKAFCDELFFRNFLDPECAFG